MSPDRPQPDHEGRRAVISGLVALVAVSVVVGLLLGGVALVGSRAAGLGQQDTTSGGEKASLYLPRPSRTDEPKGPSMTLDTQGTTPTSSSSQPAQPQKTKQAKDISLSAGQTQVSAMGRIDLTGVYTGGEGAVLQVQKQTGGQWQDFPVTCVVSNQTFSTYVQTSFVGQNKFRVVDSDTGLASNPVTVTVG